MSDMSEQEIEKKYPVKQSATFAGSTLVTMGLLDVLAHLGPTGLLIGGIASYVAWKHGPEVYEQVRELIPLPAQIGQPEQAKKLPQRSGRSFIDRALGRYPEVDLVDDPEETEQDAESPALDDTAFAQATAQKDVPSVPRLTIDQIVEHIVPNSYKIYIGRSLTRPGNPAIPISIYNRHLKIIGASQYGKSSMAAALLEIITRTHDPQHVLVALLDREDQTSKLFINIPHRAQVFVDDRPVVLHAHTPEQVLEYLGYLVQIMEYRYTQSKTEMLQEPIILVFLEEFIALKDYFKSRIDAVAREEKEQAKRDYTDLVFRIKELARRGLKARMQLLMCAQCDYRDDDLQEALINITAGMSFAVRVTAAQAAGFYQTELLARNAKDDKKGQAVVEMPDCKDLVLAPEYDLEQRLIALEKQQGKSANGTSNSRMPSIATTNRDQLPHMIPVPGDQPTSVPSMENTTWQPLSFPRSEKRRHTVGIATELRAALDSYQPGMTYRDLGKAMNYTDGEARLIWQELKRRSLLHATGSEPEQETARPEVPPVPQKPLNQADLERALRAYDEGNTTVDALAVALGMSSWTVRPLYAAVRKLRKNAG